MSAVSKGAVKDDEMNEVMASHFQHSDVGGRHVPEKLKQWMLQNSAILGSSNARRGDTFLWFMTWGCNRAMTTQYMWIALWYILLRAASQFFYSGLIGALGDNWPSTINNYFESTADDGSLARPKLLTLAVVMTAVLFSIISVASAYVSYKMDKRGKVVVW